MFLELDKARSLWSDLLLMQAVHRFVAETITKEGLYLCGGAFLQGLYLLGTQLLDIVTGHF